MISPQESSLLKAVKLRKGRSMIIDTDFILTSV